GNREVPRPDRPLKEGGPRGKHGFPRGSTRQAGDAHVMTSRFPNVGSAWTIGGNCHVPISGTAVSRLTLTSTRYGLPALNAVSNASARSPGWSIEIEPAPIAPPIL